MGLQKNIWEIVNNIKVIQKISHFDSGLHQKYFDIPFIKKIYEYKVEIMEELYCENYNSLDGCSSFFWIKK